MTDTGTLIEQTAVITDPAARRRPWTLMGGAVSLEGCKSTDEVLDRANLNWTAEKSPLYTVYDNGTGPQHLDVPDRYAVVRSDNLKVLGDVGSKFEAVQNRSLVEFGKALVDEADIDWDAGGTLKGGGIAFLSFKVPFEIDVAGTDRVESWVLLSNGHDGSHAFRASVLPHRISCGNQVGRKRNGAHAIRHIGDVRTKVDEVRLTLGLVDKYMVEFKAIADQLADIDVDVTFFEDFVEELLPIDAATGVRANTVKQRQRAALRQNWRDTTTVSPDLHDTAWGALNVVTEVIDHGHSLEPRKSKGDQAERRFLSTWDGVGANLRDRAFGLLLGEAEEPGSVHAGAERRRQLLTVGGSL